MADQLDNNDLNDEVDRWLAELPAIKLNPRKIPKPYRHMIPYAQQWGVYSDVLRFAWLERKPSETLEEIVRLLSPYCDELDEWLTGPEAHADYPSKEYLAFTSMCLAMYDAQIILKLRQNRENE